MWSGDLRLQALTLYEIGSDTSLVTRCLYLLAALAYPDGRIPACIYENPEPHRGSEFILDYSILFVDTLADYHQNTSDIDTVRALWTLVQCQLEYALSFVEVNGVFQEPKDLWLFIDWNDELDRQTSMQAVLIFGLRAGHRLANILGDQDSGQRYLREAQRLSKAACQLLREPKTDLFVSGSSRQVSWASQAFMVLAEVVSGDDAITLLRRVMADRRSIRPRTPYLYHHVVAALFHAGLEKEGAELIYSYWGAMVDAGATCFWEVFDPDEPRFSPYGDFRINSHCHAWSCTPAWFIRRYPHVFTQ